MAGYHRWHPCRPAGGSASAAHQGKRSRRFRIFAAGDALDRKANYYVQWSDLDSLLTDVTDYSRWLLITGPWQSGKSSLMHALAEGAQRKGFHAVITTLSKSMVAAANNVAKHENDAADEFFELVAERLAANSRGYLSSGKGRGMQGILRMFQNLDRDVIWFIDEASFLNDIRRTSVIRTFLSDLRSCKQECISRNPAGSYYLRSFVLVGTPKLKQLIGDLRQERIEAAGEDYVPYWDPLGNSVSPLNMERLRMSEALKPEEVMTMLNDYSKEHDVKFRLTEAGSLSEGEQAMRKLSNSIVELRSGHKGMVGSCCEYLMRQSIDTLAEWRRHVRIGHVAEHVFVLKVYSKMISNILDYSEEARGVVLECIKTGGSTKVEDLFVLLRPINDGVLVQENRTVAVASGLLLSAFLEDCSFVHLEALPPIGSFVEVIQSSFPYMDYDRLMREEVLNANGQPSEYAWQCEFFLSLKFVLENGYKSFKYKIMVEAKKRDVEGKRRTRLDFLVENSGCPPKGFEIQGAGAGTAGRDSIKRHIVRSEKYRLLHGCEMHYVYFQHGNYGVDAKAVIEEVAPKFQQLNYWHVQFVSVEHRATSAFNLGISAKGCAHQLSQVPIPEKASNLR